MVGPCRVLLNPCGTAGDVHPYLAIGKWIHSEGHDVILISNPSHRSKVEREGLSFVGAGEPLDWNEVAQNPRVHRPRTAWRETMTWSVGETMRETFRAIESLHRPGKTVLVAPPWSFGARIANEKLTIPLVTLLQNPILLRSLLRSPVVPQMYLPDWMPRWMKAFQYFYGDFFVIDRVIGKSLRSFRRELGLPRVSRRWMQQWWFSEERVLGLFDPTYVIPQPDWQVMPQMIGPTNWDPAGDPETVKEVTEFLLAGERPLCFVPGSIGANDHAFELVSAACNRLGHRLLTLSGRFARIWKSDSGREMRASYAPLAEVLPHCQMLIHCGCAGTGTQALRLGVPQIIWPRVNDQFDMAERFRRLGVASVCRGRSLRRADLVAAMQWGVQPAIADCCRRAADRLLPWDSAEVASRVILGMLQKHAWP